MALVISCSVPDSLVERWKESGLDISPSKLFQTALETELTQTNKHLVYWSTRALAAEKKLEAIKQLANSDDRQVKKFLAWNELA
jgi:post-segregation antitoxin (ccd killing protein)